jgi:transcriptional regulator with XRE-family HTH domain
MRVVEDNPLRKFTVSIPDSLSLIVQLGNRAARWHAATGIPQAQMARAIQVQENNYSSFLKGRRGISATSTCLLLKYLSLPPDQVVATFSKNNLSCRILNLQERGKKLKLEYVPGLSGTDPNDGAGERITVAPSPHDQDQCLTDTLQTLNNLRGLHAKAISAIDAYIAQAKVNRQGSTAPTSQRFSRRY